MKLFQSFGMAVLLTLVPAFHTNILAIQTVVTSDSLPFTDTRLLQRQGQIDVRGTPFQSLEELTTAVDTYLEYHYAEETYQRPNINALYEQLIDTHGHIEYWDVGLLDNFANLFNSKRNPLATVATPNLELWNVGHNVDRPLYLQDMFLGANVINFNVQNWNTERAVHFNGMFENAVSFEGHGLESWNVTSGTLFMSMFSGCIGLHHNLDLSSWQLPRAERLDSLFRHSSYGGLVGGDLCAWNDWLKSTATVKDMFMQSQCISSVDPNLAARNDPTVELSLCSPCDKSKTAMFPKPNIFLVMADQMRFDMIRHVQDELEHYGDFYKIQTPNLDRLLQSGAYFRNAYVSRTMLCLPLNMPMAVVAPVYQPSWLYTGSSRFSDSVLPNALASSVSMPCMWPSQDVTSHRVFRRKDGNSTQ
jgi:hypothetical protein